MHAQAPAMKQWEYKAQYVEWVGTPKGQAELNALGQQGWELAQIVGGDQSPSVMVVFKRAKP